MISHHRVRRSPKLFGNVRDNAFSRRPLRVPYVNGAPPRFCLFRRQLSISQLSFFPTVDVSPFLREKEARDYVRQQQSRLTRHRSVCPSHPQSHRSLCSLTGLDIYAMGGCQLGPHQSRIQQPALCHRRQHSPLRSARPAYIRQTLASITVAFTALVLASQMCAVKERRGSKVTSKYLSVLSTLTA